MKKLSEIDRQRLKNISDANSGLTRSPTLDLRIKEYAFHLLEKDEKIENAIFNANMDYTEVWKNGVKYSLTPRQGKVIKLLYEQYKNGHPVISKQTIIDLIGPKQSNYIGIWKDHKTVRDALLEDADPRGHSVKLKL